MSAFLLLHGWYGSPPGHWQHWLAGQLRAQGHTVHFPELPQPLNPELEPWLETVRYEMNAIKTGGESGLSVICHSLGAILWLHYLQRHPETRIDRLLLVAPPGPEARVQAIHTFFPIPFDREILHQSTPSVLLISSNADPYCPSGAHRIFGEALRIPSHVLPDQAGHINMDSGFGPWPWMQHLAAGEGLDNP